MDLITTRSNKFIDLNDINTKYQYKVKTPSIFNTMPKNSTSNRYQPFNTLQAINVLADYGYMPTQIRQKYSLKNASENDKFQQHVVRFAHKDQDLTAPEYNEIIIYNSYDGESSLKSYRGYYRFCCSNNFVIGDGVEDVIKHFKHNTNSFENFLKSTIDGIQKTNEIIDRLKNTSFDDDQIFDLSKNILSNRWEYVENEKFERDEFTNELIEKAYFDDVTIKSLNKPRRSEDVGNSAWLQFNRIQENMTKPLPIKSVGKAKIVNERKSKEMNSINDDRKLNLKLWDNVSELVTV
jgi:hypothetical protein